MILLIECYGSRFISLRELHIKNADNNCCQFGIEIFSALLCIFCVVFLFRYSAHTPARLSFKTHRLRLCNAGRAKSKSAAHTGAQPLQSLSIFESLIEDMQVVCYFVLIAFPDDNRQRYYCLIAESEIKEWVKSKT